MIPVAKYITIDHPNLSTNMIIFGCGIHHRTIAAKLGYKVLSAGFANLSTMKCYGKSSSLKISSNPIEDDIWLSSLYE